MNQPKSETGRPEPEADYYMDRGLLVFTASYLLKRGYCCGNGCRHCPYRDSSPAKDSAAEQSGRPQNGGLA